MTDVVSTDEQEAEPSENNGLSTWDEIRQLADELELEIHLASMDARTQWRAIELRLAAFEQRMKDTGQRASKAVTDELEALWKALRGIRKNVAKGN